MPPAHSNAALCTASARSESQTCFNARQALRLAGVWPKRRSEDARDGGLGFSPRPAGLPPGGRLLSGAPEIRQPGLQVERRQVDRILREGRRHEEQPVLLGAVGDGLVPLCRSVGLFIEVIERAPDPERFRIGDGELAPRRDQASCYRQ